jgi:hypothetical protein
MEWRLAILTYGEGSCMASIISRDVRYDERVNLARYREVGVMNAVMKMLPHCVLSSCTAPREYPFLSDHPLWNSRMKGKLMIEVPTDVLSLVYSICRSQSFCNDTDSASSGLEDQPSLYLHHDSVLTTPFRCLESFFSRRTP